MVESSSYSEETEAGRAEVPPQRSHLGSGETALRKALLTPLRAMIITQGPSMFAVKLEGGYAGECRGGGQ